MNEVVNGIIASGQDVRLGILPVGTANDYARSLGIPLDLEVISVVLANGSTTGGGIEMVPAARLDDGRLDVVAIPALGLPELASLVPKILTGSHLEDGKVVVRRGERVIAGARPTQNASSL